MRITIITLIFVILFSSLAMAEINPVVKLLWESAIETDRHQSYNWHFATKENPTVSPKSYLVYEMNPFYAGTTKEEFDKKINETKKLMNLIYNRNKLLYTTITIVELYVVYHNNQKSKICGYPETWTIAYSWQF